MSTPLLSLQNVEAAYGPVKALRGVSLAVAEGCVAAVLGSNGAGKTTTLKTISGILDPRKGTIVYRGENIAAKEPATIVRRGISHVPEGREVFPLLSVRDNLLMGAYTRRDRDARRVHLAHGLVHLGQVHRDEHYGVGPCGNRSVHEGDLLGDVVGLFRDVVHDPRPVARRGALRAQPGSIVRRVGAVLGEYRDRLAGHFPGET